MARGEKEWREEGNESKSWDISFQQSHQIRLAVEHYSVSVQGFLSLCAQYTVSCKLTIVKQGLRRICVIVWMWPANMEDRGQKASCACSHWWIKQENEVFKHGTPFISKKTAPPDGVSNHSLLYCTQTGVFLPLCISCPNNNLLRSQWLSKWHKGSSAMPRKFSP